VVIVQEKCMLCRAQEVAIFGQTAANFSHRKYECSKFQFCYLIFSKWGLSALNFVFLVENFINIGADLSMFNC